MKKSTLFLLTGFLLSTLLFIHEDLRAQSWARVGNDSTSFKPVPGTGGISMILDNKGVPYIFDQDALGNSQLTARKLAGNSWTQLGTAGFATPAVGMAFAVDSAGEIYAAPSNGNFFPMVYKYSGVDWNLLPQANPLNVSSSNWPATAVDKNGKAYYALYDGGTYNPVVFTYNGTDWVEVGAGQLGNGTGGQLVEMAVDSHNTPYIVYDVRNNNPYGNALLVVEKFDGTNWVKLGTTTLYTSLSNHAIAFDKQDVPYIVDGTGTYQTGFNFKVVKLSGGDWVDVGGNISALNGTGFSQPAALGSGNFAQIYLAIGADNRPVIGWYQSFQLLQDPNSGSLTAPEQVLVVKFDGSNWVSVSDAPVYSSPSDKYGRPQPGDIDQSNIAFAADTLGNTFVAYPVGGVMKVFMLSKPLAANTISFSAVTTAYGAADLAPGATSTNKSAATPITYVIADPTIAMVVNGKIHILKAGSTNITASQAANATYAAATPVQVSLTVNKGTQKINFPPLDDKAVTDADFDPGATAGSGLTVTYTSSNNTIATITGGKIHLLKGGDVVITAHQAGNGNYQAAPDSAHSLHITAITTTVISGADLTATYGDADFEPGITSNSPVTMIYSFSDPTVASFTSGMIHILHAGSTQVTVTQAADAAHTAATLSIGLIVSQEWQYIQFSSFPVKSLLDGDFPAGAVANAGNSGTPNGLLVTYTSSDPTIATVTGGIVHILLEGTVIITAHQEGNVDYLPARDVFNTLSVVKDTQSISFPSLSGHLVGDADVAPGAVASSGLPVTYMISDPSVVRLANGRLHWVHAGTAFITAHQPGNDRYQEAADVNQVITVNPSPDKPYPTGDSLVAYCTGSTSLQVNVYPAADQQALLELFDLYGQRVYSQEVTLSAHMMASWTISVGNVPAGIYTVRIAGQFLRLSQKVRIAR